MCVWSCMMLHIFCPTICYDEIYQIIFIYHILIHNLHTTRSDLMGIFIYSCFLICYRNFVHFKHFAHLLTISYGNIIVYRFFEKISAWRKLCFIQYGRKYFPWSAILFCILRPDWKDQPKIQKDRASISDESKWSGICLSQEDERNWDPPPSL